MAAGLMMMNNDLVAQSTNLPLIGFFVKELFRGRVMLLAYGTTRLFKMIVNSFWDNDDE